MNDDWHRRYEANQKVPGLPDTDDIDYAMNRLRSAVDAIDESHTVTSVVRVLRHQRDLAAEVLHNAEPTCTACGAGRVCLGCDDTRPTAEKLGKGWQFVSPLGRWETIERVTQDNDYAPVRVWTKETGPDYSWLIPGWRKVDAIEPLWRRTGHGTPVIRIVELDYDRAAPMYAIATLDTVYRPEVPQAEDSIACGHYSREHGWRVTHRPDGGGDTVTVECGRSKAKARTALRAVARQHAEALGVKVTEQSKTK